MSFIDKLPFWFNKESDKELGSVLNSIDNELNSTHKDILQLKEQFNMHTSTGIWLDEHGSWYGVGRLPNEGDRAYSNRIWKEIVKGRVTIPAILEALDDILYDNTSALIHEPYKVIFKLSESKMSEDHLLQDGIYVSHGVIDIVINGPIPDGILELVEEIRAGGIQVFISSCNELTDVPLIIYKPEANPLIDYLNSIELICPYNSDSIVLSQTLLGGREVLSGGGLHFTCMVLELTLKAKFKRAVNSPTINLDPGYRIPNSFVFNHHVLGSKEVLSGGVLDTPFNPEDYPEFYFNSTLTEREIFLDRNSVQVGSKERLSTETESQLKPVSMASYFKVGSVVKVKDLLGSSIKSLDPSIEVQLITE